ncbi:AAA domain-containing protein [Cladochytrium replicatum]|nr:AAA domain-containing protein [Cladochytrium replicatum]
MVSFPKRIVVVGTTGSGKSTLARNLSKALGLPLIECDDLLWNDDWVESSFEEVRARVTHALQGASDGWVYAGNLGPKYIDIVGPNTDMVIWLNYPWLTGFWRLLKRSIRRIISKEPLFGTNCVETWSKLFSWDSILRWYIASFGKLQRRYQEFLVERRSLHLKTDVQILILTKPAEADELVKAAIKRE